MSNRQTSPKGALPSAYLHANSRTQKVEKMIHQRDKRVFPPLQWPQDQSLALERSHIYLGLFRFCRLFFLKHPAFRAGSCSHGKVPHDFSQSKTQIFTAQFGSYAAQTCKHGTYSVFLCCDVLPLLPFLFMFLWVYWDQRRIYNMWHKTEAWSPSWLES